MILKSVANWNHIPLLPYYIAVQPREQGKVPSLKYFCTESIEMCIWTFWTKFSISRKCFVVIAYMCEVQSESLGLGQKSSENGHSDCSCEALCIVTRFLTQTPGCSCNANNKDGFPVRLEALVTCRWHGRGNSC